MWVKIDDGFATHPKILTAGIIALGIQIRAICYASQNQTDGVLPHSCIPLLLTGLDHLSIETGGNAQVGFGVDAGDIDWPAHMVAHALWDQHDKGYVIHDFLEWNVSKSERDSWRTKLSRSGKKGSKARWNKGKSSITNPIAKAIAHPITKDITHPIASTSTSTSISTSSSSLHSSSLDAEFEQFWNAYPKKVGRKAAQKAFQNAQDRPRINDLLAAIATQRASPQWLKDGGQFIPHPATWLNQGRWADVAVAVRPSVFEEFLSRGEHDADTTGVSTGLAVADFAAVGTDVS